MHLLPGGQLLVISKDTVELHNYTTTEETTDAMTPALPLCMWRKTFGSDIRLRSERLSTRTTTRFILVVEDTFHSLDIQNDPVSNVAPVVTKVMTTSYNPISFRLYLGYFRVAAFRGDIDVELLQYPLKYCIGMLRSTKSCSLKFPCPFAPVYMDEHSGRTVIPQNGLEQSVVIDLL